MPHAIRAAKRSACRPLRTGAQAAARGRYRQSRLRAQRQCRYSVRANKEGRNIQMIHKPVAVEVAIRPCRYLDEAKG